jgi:hypothetical protein
MALHSFGYIDKENIWDLPKYFSIIIDRFLNVFKKVKLSDLKDYYNDWLAIIYIYIYGYIYSYLNSTVVVYFPFFGNENGFGLKSEVFISFLFSSNVILKNDSIGFSYNMWLRLGIRIKMEPINIISYRVSSS